MIGKARQLYEEQYTIICTLVVLLSILLVAVCKVQTYPTIISHGTSYALHTDSEVICSIISTHA